MFSRVESVSPRVFVSYARGDIAYAKSLAEDLRERGFRVFLDVAPEGAEGIDPGENFVSRLAGELRRATAVAAVVTKAYASSRWAQAELYYGVALGRVIIPVIVPPASIADLDTPLRQLLAEIQAVTVPAVSKTGARDSTLGASLQRARRRHRRTLVTRLLAVLLPAILLGAGLWWGVSRIDALEATRRRERILQEITTANAAYPAPRIESLASQLAGDRQAMGQLHVLVGDRTVSDVGRVNALVLSGALTVDSQPRRWYVDGLRLDRATLQTMPVVDASFSRAQWREVRFRDLTLSGVHFTGGLDFSMSGVVFERVNFHGSTMDSIKAIDVRFINSKFRAAEIDITNFAKVRFLTDRPPERGNPTITPQYTLFEASKLISHVRPPDAGVMDLSTPEDFVIFEEVLFVNCRLEGWFDARWFRRSTFDGCTLPPSLTREALEAAGNTVS